MFHVNFVGAFYCIVLLQLSYHWWRKQVVVILWLWVPYKADSLRPIDLHVSIIM